MSDSLRPHGLKPTRLLRPWDFQGKSTGVGYHFLLQGIFPTQDQTWVSWDVDRCFYCMSHQGSLKQVLSLKKKEKWLRRQSCRPRGLNLEVQSIIPKPWNLMEFVQLNFEIAWDWWFLYLFFFSFFCMQMSITIALCQHHHSILGAENLFSSFTSPQMERNFASG